MAGRILEKRLKKAGKCRLFFTQNLTRVGTKNLSLLTDKSLAQQNQNIFFHNLFRKRP